jgi:hypothetical protein
MTDRRRNSKERSFHKYSPVKSTIRQYKKSPQLSGIFYVSSYAEQYIGSFIFIVFSMGDKLAG